MENNKLDPHFKEMWITALESGDYEQTHTTMSRKYSNDEWVFCCLGVAGCLLGVDRDNMTKEATLSNWPNLTQSVGLSPDIQHVLWRCNDGYSQESFDHLDPYGKRYVPDFVYENVKRLNPNGVSMTFPEIANIIRENF